MLASLRSNASIATKPIQRAMLGLSVAYATAGLFIDKPVIVPHFLSGLGASLLLLAAGSLPLLISVIFAALWADRLGRFERRLLLLGAGVASLILLPLLSLVF